jgi:hypothetical protein
MPLAYGRAFGGQVQFEELSYGYPANPKGLGYYRSVAEATGQPLANIAEPGLAPTVWREGDQRPAGWGPYPNFWALRATAGVVTDPKAGGLPSLRPDLFNHAHPDLVLDEVRANDEIVIDGLLDTSIRARVPAAPAVVTATVGRDRVDVNAPIDGLFFWTDERKLVVTQRARFRYVLKPEETRLVHVRKSVDA